ncbi:MAG: 3-oxoadipyl-CoA thiolase [Bradyrhizobiaceae bacterium]|nr:MAG: 3-oxoadipyl-CoA thiolase [Bradyrhizobiaceae bacterium]
MLEAYVYDGLRSPFGRQGGGLARIRPDDLLAQVMQAVMSRSKFAADEFEDVIVGCANQAGEDSRCVARHASLLAGMPVGLGGTVIQRNCGSGLGALVSAAHAVTAGEGDLFLSGGVESMSRAPFVMGKAEAAFSRDMKIFDSAVGARFPNREIEKRYGADTMPQTADNLAREHQLSRDEVDRFALLSQQKYAAAKSDGFFNAELAAIQVAGPKKGVQVTVQDDEFPRADTSLETLGSLRAIHDGGVTTAGNASGINDGAVVLTVGSREAGEKAGSAPMVRILSAASVGVEPRVMGIGPVPAIKKALERAKLKLNDMDVIEINEAFSAQVLACLRQLGVDADDPRVNPNGGAIALGHPLGASGPRLVLTAARELQRRNGKYAVVSMCVGVGQGVAMVLERV